MPLSLHQRLATIVLDRALLEPAALCDALLRIGQALAGDPSSEPVTLWVKHSTLSSVTVSALLRELDEDELGASPTIPLLPELFEESSGLEGAIETFMSIPAAFHQRRAQQVEAFERVATRTHTPALGTRALYALSAAAELSGSAQRFERAEDAHRDALPQPAEGSSPRAEASPSSASTSLWSGDPFSDRYLLGELLGQGGGGRVMRAYDRLMGRSVAMKIMRDEGREQVALLQRFITEAQTTGQLEHPNIIPIYDLGTLPTGEVYYTMRELRKTSLREVLRALQRDDPRCVEEYNLVQLVIILKQVCQAIHYAHVRGIIHRDLKPDNIMLGDYGEVLVMDWGLARMMEPGSPERTSEGHTLGTPAYMPPEQARGELQEVDHLSDIYSLGAILYEILTLQPPFTGEDPLAVMWSVVEGELKPPRLRAPEREVPEELERICQRAMSHTRHVRFASARQLHDALADWIEGIQPREAAMRTKEGHIAAQRYRILWDDLELMSHQVRELAARIEDWAPMNRKRELWACEDRRERARIECATAFGQAVAHYTQALAHHSANEEARRGLADLYWARFAQAEAERDLVNALYFHALVERYDDASYYAPLLQGCVNLRVVTEPPGADLKLAPLEVRDRLLCEATPLELGPSPALSDPLPIGPYLLRVDAPGSPPVQLPVLLRRGRDAQLSLRLPQPEDWRQGFAFVPAGDYLSGGDPEAFDPRPSRGVFVDDFFCAVLPVTFADYLAFIDALQQDDPAAAARHAPQVRGADGLLARHDAELGRWVPEDILIEGPLRELYPLDQGHEWQIPVVGVGADDVRAYIRWRAQRDGLPYRLPTEDELEKAGRGVDGRLFPWGDHFDATFCRMRFSRAQPCQLEPVGAFAHDISPYGVRDLAGGVQEWCESPTGQTALKGGSWNQDQRACRLASRVRLMSFARTASIGFRIVYDLRAPSTTP